MAAEFTFLSAVTTATDGASFHTASVPGVQVHVYSAAGSTASVLIEGSENNSVWLTLATITNPGTGGEIWQGPAMAYTRVQTDTQSAGAVTAVGHSLTVNPGAWAAVSSATVTAPTRGLIKYDVTNAALVAAGGVGNVSTVDVAVGTLPAKSRLVATYIVVTSAEDSAQNFTGSLGTVATDYVDWIIASDMKSATVYGNGAAERGATNIDGALYYATATPIIFQPIKTTTHLHDLTNFAATIYVEYVTYP